MRLVLLFALLLACVTVQAQELKPFVRGSNRMILTAHQGKPFILALWSLDCAYCRDNLVMLGKLHAKHGKLDIVLVATDTPAQHGAIESVLRKYHLELAESWVFSDDFVERLRFEIDPQWYGELPRTYFIDADGNASTVSGKLAPEQIEIWLKKNGKHESSPTSMVRCGIDAPV